MTKRQLIDEIVTLNQTAEPSFLARFDLSELDEYLRHLRMARSPRMRRGSGRFRKYFDNCPSIKFKPAPPEALDRFQSDDADISRPQELEEFNQLPTPETPFTPDLEHYDSASQSESIPQGSDEPETAMARTIQFEVADETAEFEHSDPESQSGSEEETLAAPALAIHQPKPEPEDDDFEKESETWLY